MPCHSVPPRPILKRPSPSPFCSLSASLNNNTANNADGGSHHHHHHQHNNNNFNHHHHHPHHSHAVHFPPTPSLTSIFPAYPSAAYDRSPIVIAPNSCTLPERGCPGRTYYSVEDYPRSHDKHPRAFASNPSSSAAAHPDPMVVGTCPPLIPDLSSESEESDGFASPFPEPSRSAASPHVYCANGLPVNMPRQDIEYFSSVSVVGDPDKVAVTTTIDTATALSFLPYPPSPLIRSGPYLGNDEEEERTPTNAAKHRRRRHSRERDSGINNNNNNNNSNSNPTPNAGEAQHQPQRERRSKSSNRTKSSDRAVSISSGSSSFGMQDDGCLGGF